MTDAERRRRAIKAATLAAHRSVKALDRQMIAELERAYREARDGINARISSHAGADGVLTLRELRSARDQVNEILAKLRIERERLLGLAMVDAANLGAKPFDLGEITGAASIRIAQDALRFVRSFVGKDGLQLSDRLWRVSADTSERITRALEQAIIRGQSAIDAAREYVARGERAPAGLAEKARQANATAIARTVEKELTGAQYNAQRLFRTEINRAHGEAFMMRSVAHPDFAGFRYLLSPSHPEPDICDLLSTQNLYGLGAGVYPDRKRCPWPAHPNTLSFLEVVFTNEVTDKDRAGKESSAQALARLPKDVQAKVEASRR